MRPPVCDARDVRCTGCGALLARLESGGLSISRGDLQATLVGDFLASLVCYRPHCRKLNVLPMKPAPAAHSPGPAG
jgi:hypothetical protein